MDRDLTIGRMVRLPRTNAASAAALAEQLLSAAEAEKGSGLPVFLERPRARLRVALDALISELMPREEADTAIRLEADRVLDDAWRSFSTWLGALAGASDGSFEGQDRLRSLNNTVFKDGLSFIILAYREEWVQSETRLNAIADGGFEPLIEKMSGTPLLENVKAAHARFGQVLGIKAPLRIEVNPLIKDRLLDLIFAVKAYVIKAAAYVDPEESGSDMLSAALLLPLAKWRDTVSRADREEEVEVDVDVDVDLDVDAAAE